MGGLNNPPISTVFTRFTSSDTWTKASNTKTAIVECLGAGGGGGGGEAQVSGVLRMGGGGAGGGARSKAIYDAAD